MCQPFCHVIDYNFLRDLQGILAHQREMTLLVKISLPLTYTNTIR